MQSLHCSRHVHVFRAIMHMLAHSADHHYLQSDLQADNALVLACNMEMDGPAVPKLAERSQIGAGEYKFGWRSAPMAFMAPHEDTMSKCEEARSAAMEALMVRLLPPPGAQKCATCCRALTLYTWQAGLLAC